MSTDDPRSRAKRHLEALKRGAAVVVTAAIAPANAGCDPVPPGGFPPPGPAPQAQCAPTDDPSTWLVGTAIAGNPLVFRIDLRIANVGGTELSTSFDVGGAALLGAPQFDATSLAQSTSVTLSLTPDAGQDRVSIETGVSCGADARTVRFEFNIADVNNAGNLVVDAVDVTQP